MASKAKKAGVKKRARRAARPATKKPSRAGKVFGVEVDPSSVDATLRRLREELTRWAKKGRYTKVRLKLRGKPILPDIPVAAFMAAEALTFWWGGLLRALLMNLGAKALVDVELISGADLEVAHGKDLLLAGELDAAFKSFLRAVQMDADCAAAHLSLGVAWRLKGDLAKARAFLKTAEDLESSGPVGDEARRLMKQIDEALASPPAPTAPQAPRPEPTRRNP